MDSSAIVNFHDRKHSFYFYLFIEHQQNNKLQLIVLNNIIITIEKKYFPKNTNTKYHQPC
jgi:hypothetical protein